MVHAVGEGVVVSGDDTKQWEGKNNSGGAPPTVRGIETVTVTAANGGNDFCDDAGTNGAPTIVGPGWRRSGAGAR